MAKYLIVNADDYGMCNSANEAVEELFLGGYLKSATVMLPCPTAEHAVNFSIAHPEYPIGIHLTMTSEWGKYRWKPLSAGKSLIDEEGFMWHESDQVENNATYEDLENEIRAQIEYAHFLGMKPSHIDNHMGSLYGIETGRIGLAKMTLRICGEYGYAYRLYSKADKRCCLEGFPYPIYKASAKLASAWAKKYKVYLPDYLLFPDWNNVKRMSYETYRDLILDEWSNIPEGITETYIHPSIESDELKSITGRWKDRVWEYRLMKDPYVHQTLQARSITLISYRELIKMRKAQDK